MKKLTLLSVAALALASCSTTSKNAGVGDNVQVIEQNAKVWRPVTLDHKGDAFGKEVPSWVIDEQSQIQAYPEYKDLYVYKFESPQGASLQAVTQWAENFQAPARLAEEIQIQVKSKFAGAAAGDLDTIESYQEKVVQTLAQVDLSGLKLQESWWILRQYYDQNDGSTTDQKYTNYALYSISKKTLNDLLQKSLEEADATAPLNDNERTVRARVKEAFNSGF